MLELDSRLPSPDARPRRLRRPRLGIAGLGWIGRTSLDAIVASDLADIVAVADPAVHAAEAVARRLATPMVVSGRFDDLLEQPLDGIVIATPSEFHVAQATAALGRGIAVFCQTPVGRNSGETSEVLAAARRADRLLGVDLSHRHNAGLRRIRECIAAGRLGRVYAVEAVFHRAYGPDKPWFYDAALSGGGCLLDLGIHLLDLARWALGYPAVETVCGHTSRRAGASVEDYATAVVKLGGGASVQLACSWLLPIGCEARLEVGFYGTGGGAVFRNEGGSLSEFTAERLHLDRTRETLFTSSEPWAGCAAVEWARRLTVSSAFDPEALELETVASTIDRIYRAGA